MFEETNIFEVNKVLTDENKYPIVLNKFGEWMVAKKYVIDDGLLVPVDYLDYLRTEKYENSKFDLAGRVNYLCEKCKAVTIGQCLC
jgi:hypothetical protein